MKINSIFSVLGIIFAVILTILGLIKVWVPDAIPMEFFVKLVITFGVLIAGSLAVSFIKSGSQPKKDTE